MLLHLGLNKEIVSYCNDFSEEESKTLIEQGLAVIYEGEFNFFMGEPRAGFVTKYYYDEEKKNIRIDYEPKPEEEIYIDPYEAKLDYLIMMQEGENV